MTINPTLNMTSMLQSYRQLNAAKQESKDEEIAFDSVDTDNATQSQSMGLHAMIAEMEQAWLEDSKLSFTTALESLRMDDRLSNYFGYDKESFRDSYGILSADEINAKKATFLQQNPRYAEAMHYRFDVSSNGESVDSGFQLPPQISIIPFLTDENISPIDKGYSRSDFNTAAQTIEKMLDNVLKEQFEQDPDSKETNVLLLLKAKLQAMPEIIEQIRGNAVDYTRKAIEQNNEKAFASAIYTADLEVTSELQIFHDIGVRLRQYLSPEQQEQFAELEDVIVNYYQNNWNKSFAFRGFDPMAQSALSEAARTLGENLKKLAVEDGLETLLELGEENQAAEAKIVDEEISRETLLARAKKKASSDSLLQKLLNSKTGQQASAEASA
ncbi:MAG: hypothetical protein K2N12_09400 [Helicobacter sp.]|nr:hypothetical protein [Helicobacter sp.]